MNRPKLGRENLVVLPLSRSLKSRGISLVAKYLEMLSFAGKSLDMPKFGSKNLVLVKFCRESLEKNSDLDTGSSVCVNHLWFKLLKRKQINKQQTTKMRTKLRLPVSRWKVACQSCSNFNFSANQIQIVEIQR